MINFRVLYTIQRIATISVINSGTANSKRKTYKRNHKFKEFYTRLGIPFCMFDFKTYPML